VQAQLIQSQPSYDLDAVVRLLSEIAASRVDAETAISARLGLVGALYRRSLDDRGPEAARRDLHEAERVCSDLIDGGWGLANHERFRALLYRAQIQQRNHFPGLERGPALAQAESDMDMALNLAQPDSLGQAIAYFGSAKVKLALGDIAECQEAVAAARRVPAASRELLADLDRFSARWLPENR
jgi:hypothetical protein